MTRYYVCPIVGSGKREDPYRPAIADYGLPYTCVLSSTPDGSPAKSWALCLVEAQDHNVLMADPTITALGDASSLVGASKSVVAAATGVDLASATTWRDVILKLGQAHEPTFVTVTIDERAGL